MKLKQLLDLLNEAFDTKLKHQTRWEMSKDKNTVIANCTGWVDEIEISIDALFTTAKQLQQVGVKVEFGLRTKEESERGVPFSYDFAHIKNGPANKIMGAVANVLKDDLPLPWSFMYATTKDNVLSRIRLYTAMFRRCAPPGMVVDSIHDQRSGGVILAHREHLQVIKPVIEASIFRNAR